MNDKIESEIGATANELTFLVEDYTNRSLHINAKGLDQPEIGLTVSITVRSANNRPDRIHCMGVPDLQLASAVASIIGLLVSLWQVYQREQEKATWDRARAMKLIGDQMLTRGVVDYKVAGVQNYEALLSNNGQPCVFTVKAKNTSDKYDVYIFGNGKARTMRVRPKSEY